MQRATWHFTPGGKSVLIFLSCLPNNFFHRNRKVVDKINHLQKETIVYNLSIICKTWKLVKLISSLQCHVPRHTFYVLHPNLPDSDF